MESNIRRSKLLLLVAYLSMIVVIFVLPLYSVESYSIMENTTSHLGAQHAPYAWVMNTIFIMLGVATMMRAYLMRENLWISRYLLMIFGAALIITAIFKHRPIVSEVEFNVLHDQLHSLFASGVGFAFVLFSFSFVLSNIDKKVKVLAVLLGSSATILSLMMLRFPEYMGVLQRVMFIGSFYWIIQVTNIFEKQKTLE